LRSRGHRDGDTKGEESTKDDVPREPPREEEGDMYARSPGLIKAMLYLFFYLARFVGIRVLVKWVKI